MNWKNATGRNILLRVKGQDPRLSKQQLVLHAYYDSMSVVPTIARGGECLQHRGVAADRQDPKGAAAGPHCALAGNGRAFRGMKGEKSFLRSYIRGARSERRVRQLFDTTDAARRDLEDSADRVWEEKNKTVKAKNQPEKTQKRSRKSACARWGASTRSSTARARR